MSNHPRDRGGSCDQALAAINQFSVSHRRSFNAAVEQAQLALSDLRDALNSQRISHIAALDTAVRIEAMLKHTNAADDFDIRTAVRMLHRLRQDIVTQRVWQAHSEFSSERSPGSVSRKAQCVTGLTVRLLPPAHRPRYKQEFETELAELGRRAQGRYVVRQACRAWSLRRSLTGPSHIRPTSIVVVLTACAGDVGLATLSWPAASLGGAVMIAVMWTISSEERTRRLTSLIRAIRSGRRSD